MSLESRLSLLATRVANHLRDAVFPRLLPAGGEQGEVLTKTAGSNHAVSWAPATSSPRRVSLLDTAGAVTLDLSAGEAFVVRLVGDASISITGAAPGDTEGSATLYLESAGHAVTWASQILFERGAAPRPTSTGKMCVQFSTVTGGETYVAAVLSNPYDQTLPTFKSWRLAVYNTASPSGVGQLQVGEMQLLNGGAPAFDRVEIVSTWTNWGSSPLLMFDGDAETAWQLGLGGAEAQLAEVVFSRPVAADELVLTNGVDSPEYCPGIFKVQGRNSEAEAYVDIANFAGVAGWPVATEKSFPLI